MAESVKVSPSAFIFKMNKHKSNEVIEGLIGGFKVFIVSVLLIYFAIRILKSLLDFNFPISTKSIWILSVLMGLFIAFVKFIQDTHLKNFRRESQPKLEKVKDLDDVDDNIIGNIDKKIPKIRTKFKGYCELKIKGDTCKNDVTYIFNRFYCSYCNEWHCPKHRLPEHHECKGNPKSPPGAFREIHTRQGIIVISK